MYLYLVRHGEPKREEEDPERGLSDKGYHDTRKIAGHLARLRFPLDAIYHSNKKRAYETASMLHDFIRPKTEIAKHEGLSPTDNPKPWAEKLNAETQDIMIVSHLPFLSRLAGLLLFNDSEKYCIDFRTSCIACLLRSNDTRWSVEWVLIPEIIP